MGKFNLFGNRESLNIEKVSVKDTLIDILKSTSGVSATLDRKVELFNRIIAFKGVNDGVGVSTLVANTALALEALGLTVCVFDTSFLNPAQDILLHTNVEDKIGVFSKCDWADMPYTRENVVNLAKQSLGVLSMTERNIVDMLSLDAADLADLALAELEDKFDVILMDICGEPTSLANECLIRSHQLIQVWGNSAHTMNNIETFITDCTTCSCPIDKMRNVVTNMVVPDVRTDWKTIMDKYNFNHLGSIPLSMDIARCNVTGTDLFNCPTMSDDIQAFNDVIYNILSSFIDLSDNVERGTVTGNDIVEGKVKGTITEQLAETAKDRPIINENLDLELFPQYGSSSIPSENHEINNERGNDNA